MSASPTNEQRVAFYEAALLGLRFLDAQERTPRRFGGDADLRWEALRGHLGTADRLDILVRDAAVRWGAAFSPAQVFGLPGLATDEPFGPDWAPLTEAQAQAAWKDTSTVPSVAACADALGVGAEAVDLPDIQPTTRLIVAGGAAVRSAGGAFVERGKLSWSDQVLVVADTPATRQLAGLVAALVTASAPTRLVRPMSDAETVEFNLIADVLDTVDFQTGGEAVVSSDAADSEATVARRAAEGA